MAKRISIKLNNSFQCAPNDFTADNLTITKSRQNKAGVGVGGDKSTAITFYGDSFSYVKNLLIDQNQGYLNTISVQIAESCCDKRVVFEGEIKGNSVEYCEGECKLTVNPVEKSSKADLFNFIDSHTIAEGTFINSKGHLQAPYIVEYRPLFLGYLILILGLVAKIVTTVLFPAILIAGVLLAIFGNKSLLKAGKELGSIINQFVLDTTHKHPAPKITDWFVPQLQENGFDFVSSTLQNSIYNEGHCIFAPTNEGWENPLNGLIKGNEPLKTIKEFLDDLALFFNHEWEIIDNVIYFEPKNKEIRGQKARIFGDDIKEFGQCYTPKENEQPAGRKIGQQIDGLDVAGNESKDEYQQILFWNSNNNSNQRGFEEKRAFFGMIRDFGDGVKKHPALFLGKFIASIFKISFNKMERRLLTSSGVFSENTPKIVHLDSSGRIIDNNAIFKSLAMSQFHELDNPNLSQDNKPYLFEISTDSVLDCNRFRLYEENLGRFLDIPNRYTGVGIINEIDINYIDRSFTFRGEV